MGNTADTFVMAEYADANHQIDRFLVLGRRGTDSWFVSGPHLFPTIEEATWYCRGFIDDVTAYRIIKAVGLPVESPPGQV